MGLWWQQTVRYDVSRDLTATTPPNCRFESCWPAIAQDLKGVILVYSLGNQKHEKELERWLVICKPA